MTERRRAFLQEAVNAAEEEGGKEGFSPQVIKKQVDKIKQRKATKEARPSFRDYMDYREPVPPPCRYKGKKRGPLTL